MGRSLAKQFTEEDDELLAELGVEVESKKAAIRTPREERIIAGFEEVQRFFEENGRAPQYGEDRDIFERLTDPTAGPLFADQTVDGDEASGTIYVLRSKSKHPIVAENRDVLHKIGVTSGKVERRIANAKLDPTFLMATPAHDALGVFFSMATGPKWNARPPARHISHSRSGTGYFGEILLNKAGGVSLLNC